MPSIDSHLQSFFEPFNSVARYIVAFSGGMDSTVLLHAMNRQGLPVHAVHVNHHMHRESEHWQQQCHAICSKWGIPITLAQASVEKYPQQSLEEVARQARYRLLSGQLGPKDALVTAHHQDDQAETMLLQLLRGAGPAGLSAMGSCQHLGKGMHLRPLLGFQREELKAYAQQHSLVWVEDPSNESMHFDRNFLRHKIMPELIRRWPGAVQTLSRAAGLQDEAMQCLHDLAGLDVKAAATDRPHVLDIRILRGLSAPRLKNALRGWIRSQGMRVPNKKSLDGKIEDLIFRLDLKSAPGLAWKDGEIRRYRDRLHLLKPLTEHDPGQSFQWRLDRPLVISSLNLVLNCSELEQDGVVVPKGVKELTVRFRRGGERFRPSGEIHHRSLKNLFQEGNIPPWERDRIPLVYHNDRLICVFGHWHAGPESHS